MAIDWNGFLENLYRRIGSPEVRQVILLSPLVNGEWELIAAFHGERGFDCALLGMRLSIPERVDCPEGGKHIEPQKESALPKRERPLFPSRRLLRRGIHFLVFSSGFRSHPPFPSHRRDKRKNPGSGAGSNATSPRSIRALGETQPESGARSLHFELDFASAEYRCLHLSPLPPGGFPRRAGGVPSLSPRKG